MDDSNNVIISVNHLPDMRVEPQPLFPHTVTIGGASVKLHADGTWTGDAVAFHEEAAKMKGYGSGDYALIVWLVANALRSSK